MGRTHDISISGFDLDRLESEAKFWKDRYESRKATIDFCFQLLGRMTEVIQKGSFPPQYHKDIRDVVDTLNDLLKNPTDPL